MYILFSLQLLARSALDVLIHRARVPRRRGRPPVRMGVDQPHVHPGRAQTQPARNRRSEGRIRFNNVGFGV